MKISYLAAVVILCSFGYCTCDFCRENEIGHIYVFIRPGLGFPFDTSTRYTITALTTTKQPLLGHPVMARRVENCLEAFGRVRNAVRKWKAYTSDERFPDYLVPSGEEEVFEKTIKDEIPLVSS